MASPLQAPGSASGPPSPATRVPPDRSVPARVATDGSRRNAAEDRNDGMRSGDGGDATNGGGRGRGGIRHDEADRGAVSEEDGDNEESKVDSDSARRGPLSSDEFALISVPLDTWVGRYVRITTPRHNGTTGLVHRTGNGWVNLQTAVGDVAKRAYDLVVIPEERASIGNGTGGMGKGDASRGKRYRGSKGGQPNMGSNSGSGDERKPAASRGRNPRSNLATAHSSSDSSGQDDNEEDGDEHDNGRSNRRRGRATMDDGSEFDDADQGDEDDDEGDNDDDRYDDAKIRNPRGGRPFPGAPKGRSMIKGGGRDKGDRYGTGEPVKSSGRMSITYTRRDGGGGGKPRGRVGDQDKMRERDRGRDRGDPSKAGNGRERDGMKGDGFMPMSRGKEKESDGGGSRAKRRDLGNSHALPGDSEDKLASGSGYRERGDRTRDKIGPAPAGKKDEAVIKTSWVTQMQKAKERPNLVHWRDELVAITKDSSEDFEDATLSVELMRVRCDVCYHEKSDGDKFCWNEQCWMSPVFSGYCKTDAEEESTAKSPAQQRTGYINTFGRETIIDSALTSALQAPVKWLETKRKRKLEAHEVFSEDPALYRWQCWASTCEDPNSKDPTFVEDPRFRAFDTNKRSKVGADGHARHTSAKTSPEGKRFGSRSHDDKFNDHERGTTAGLGGHAHPSAHMGGAGMADGGIEHSDVAPSPMGVIGGGSGAIDEVSVPRKAGRASQDDRVSAYANENVREMEAGVDAGDGMRMDVGSGVQGIPRRGDVGRPWP